MSGLNGRDILRELESYRLRSQATSLQVKVPTEICGAGTAEVVGYEAAEGNRFARAKSNTWLYYLKFPGESQWFIASQEEIEQWQSIG